MLLVRSAGINYEDFNRPCGKTRFLVSTKFTADDSQNDHRISLDNTDFKIISLLITGNENKQISTKLKIPLSTIQRRARNIMQSGIVHTKIEPNFKRLGIKKGLLHIYLRDGDIKGSAFKVAKMDGILSASIHIGNTDVVSDFVYEDSEQLIDTISCMKHMDGVDRVMWSEEVFTVPVDPENVLSSFKKMWNNGNNNRNSINSKVKTKVY